MFCVECGSKIDDNSSVCPGCGCQTMNAPRVAELPSCKNAIPYMYFIIAAVVLGICIVSGSVMTAGFAGVFCALGLFFASVLVWYGMRFGLKCQKDPEKQNRIITVAFVFLIVLLLAGLGSAVGYSVTQDASSDTTAGTQVTNAAKPAAEAEEVENLVINPGWTKQAIGDRIEIEGTVTNVSATESIHTYTIQATFYDNMGAIKDTGTIEGSTDLGPSESEEFSAELPFKPEYHRVTLELIKAE